MIASEACPTGQFSPVRKDEPREAGVWLIRRGDRGGAESRALEKQTKLELQTYVSGKLHELRTLPDDWDDAGGSAPSQAVTHAAYRTLDRISDYRTVFPFITPGEEGAILFEWRAGKERLELEFSPDEPPFVRYIDAAGDLKANGDLGAEGIGYENIRRFLSALSTRVWSVNPNWKRLFS
ncbi:hypothetical protein ACWC5C_00570 [Streptomyces sp. NPDC001700]|uniref:hypothetical protein n=1 Tax=Streptomyces sp. NPDC059850 TaxID=3346970 RepID=UPI00364D8FA4